VDLVDQRLQVIGDILSLLGLVDVDVLVGRVKVVRQLVDVIAILVEGVDVLWEVLQVGLEVPILSKLQVVQVGAIGVRFQALDVFVVRIDHLGSLRPTFHRVPLAVIGDLLCRVKLRGIASRGIERLHRMEGRFREGADEQSLGSDYRIG